MYTKFPYEAKIDFDKYLDEYLKREDAIHSVPTDAELKELARKSIVREQLELVVLPQQEPAMAGDTAVLKTVGQTPKFNKERVTVTLGRGLYNKDLENALIGCTVGQSVEVMVGDSPVNATVLELKRKQAPEPTDEMVAELQVKDHQGNLITTVEGYEAFIHQEKIMATLAEVNFYVLTEIIKDHPMTEYDEEDIRILGQLEKESLAKVLRADGLDPEKEIPKDWEEKMGIHSLDEFIEKRRDWYQMKIQQSYLLLNILGLPCEGKTDPLDHYEVMSELQMLVFEKIRTELERRNAQ